MIAKHLVAIALAIALALAASSCHKHNVEYVLNEGHSLEGDLAEAVRVSTRRVGPYADLLDVRVRKAMVRMGWSVRCSTCGRFLEHGRKAERRTAGITL